MSLRSGAEASADCKVRSVTAVTGTKLHLLTAVQELDRAGHGGPGGLLMPAGLQEVLLRAEEAALLGANTI
jgi:hypothetical protein